IEGNNAGVLALKLHDHASRRVAGRGGRVARTTLGKQVRRRQHLGAPATKHGRNRAAPPGHSSTATGEFRGCYRTPDKNLKSFTQNLMARTGVATLDSASRFPSNVYEKSHSFPQVLDSIWCPINDVAGLRSTRASVFLHEQRQRFGGH